MSYPGWNRPFPTSTSAQTSLHPSAYPTLGTPPPPPPQHHSRTAPQSRATWQSGSSFYFGGSAAPPSVSQSQRKDRRPSPPQRQNTTPTPLPSASGLSEATCCCCNTAVRYPRGGNSFRCTVCSTINDLNIPGVPRPSAPPDFILTASQIHSLNFVPPSLQLLFSSLQNLEASFREQNQRRPSFSTVSAFYDLIVPDLEAVDVMRESMMELLRRPGARLRESDGGWVVVLLECPLLMPKYTKDASMRNELVSRLIGLIANLPNALHHTLVQYLSSPTYPTDKLLQKVEMTTSVISYRIATCGGRYENDWGVKVGSRFDALLFAANSINRRLPLSTFSCTFIDSLGPAALVDSLHTWETRPDLFSLLQYPFLLSLGVKVHLLAHDGARQMEERAQEAARARMMYNPAELPFFVLRVRRNRIVDDSLRQISSTPFELKKSLKIVFEGEDGVDAGGLRKEWFLLLCRQLFDPQFGMFTTDEDSGLCWFNPASLESLNEFFLVGSVLGLAIYNSTTLDVPLPLAAYKKLKGEAVNLDDLAVFRPGLATGLRALLDFEGDVEEVFCRTFVGDIEEWGTVREVPLVPEGENKAVTNDNREDFVRRYVKFILDTSVEKQFSSFEQGFNQVTAGNCFSLLKGEEVELVIRGSPEPLDIDLLKSVTVYEGFIGEADPTVQIFWQIFESFSSAKQRQLLYFITGSDRIPATGSSALQLKLTNLGVDAGRWPQSHTCFNQLCLYRYENRELMESRLVRAMEESEGFGLR